MHVTAQTNTDTFNRSVADSVAVIASKNMPYGMNIYDMAKVAIQNHCPLPDEVFSYQKQLEFTKVQLISLKAIIKTLMLKKLEISQSVLINEKALSQLFANRKLNDGMLIFYGNRYGLYEGEMRTAVLTACYQTRQILTPRQITRFEQIKNPVN